MKSSMDSSFNIGGLDLIRVGIPELVEIINSGEEFVLTDKHMTTYRYRVKSVSRDNPQFPIKLEILKRLIGSKWKDASGETDVSTKFLTERPVYKII